MKNFGGKIAAVVVAVSMAFGSATAAAAATGSATSSRNDYKVSVDGKQIVFTKGGMDLAPYDVKTTDVKLIVDEDDDLLVCFTNKQGAYKGISLGDQRTLDIGGQMNSLTLASSLTTKVDVTVNSSADVSAMTVTSKNNVTIKGNVTKLTVNGAASVNVEGGTVSAANVTSSSAKLYADSDSTVKRVTTANRSNVSGSGIKQRAVSSKSDRYYNDNYYYDDDYYYNDDYYYDDDYYDNDGRYAVRLRFGSLTYDASRGSSTTYLADILDDLEDEVEATGYDEDNRDRRISGRVKWETDKKIFDERDPKSKEFSCSFRFIPSNSKYRTVRDSITVRVNYDD